MTAEFQAFLESCLPLPGLAAWSARLPDFTSASYCYNDWFARQQVEQTIMRLASAAETLRQHQVQPVRLCWVFEHARVFLALRGDGACLAFFAENRQDLPLASYDKVLDNFVRIPSA